LVLAAWQILRLQTRWEARGACIAALCICGLWGVRYYVAILLAVSAAAALTWKRLPHRDGSSRPWLFIRQAPMAAGGLVVIVTLGVTESTERLLVETSSGVLVELDTHRYWSAREAGSGYLHEERIATPEEAVRYFPLGLLYFLVVPLPWQTGALRQNL